MNQIIRRPGRLGRLGHDRSNIRHSSRRNGRKSLSIRRIDWRIPSPNRNRINKSSQQTGRRAAGRGRSLRPGLPNLLSRSGRSGRALRDTAGANHIRRRFSDLEAGWQLRMPPAVRFLIDKRLDLQEPIIDCRGQQYPLSNRLNKNCRILAVIISPTALVALQTESLRILTRTWLRILPRRHQSRVRNLLLVQPLLPFLPLLNQPLRMKTALQSSRV